MKTPRELIIERHRTAEAKLKAIRAEDLAAYARAAAEPSRQRRASFSFAVIARGLWMEVLQPWRRVWIGVAAGWVVILALNFAAGDTPASASAKASQPNPELRAVLQQQEQLLTQLLGTGTGAQAPSRPRAPGPRSAAEPPNAMAQNIAHGAPAFCRLSSFEWSERATCRRSVLESGTYASQAALA